MRKTHYSDYVKHMLRFYVKYKDKDDRSFKGVNKTNMQITKNVMQCLSEGDRAVIMAVFDPKYDVRVSLTEIVFTVSRAYNMNEHALWRLISDVQKTIAEERGLV